jgi:hypothetical protein
MQGRARFGDGFDLRRVRTAKLEHYIALASGSSASRRRHNARAESGVRDLALGRAHVGRASRSVSCSSSIRRMPTSSVRDTGDHQAIGTPGTSRLARFERLMER